ncbi:MAG: TetR family transcriptional regulator [Actinobacteria bacterium HGW-Actinobacteria-4]|nr:MAG: TetR family transcriptional regulator [Actinobacteria bacterium HGW-Actinobacteria-4]
MEAREGEGKREARKRATRRALHEAAMELFAERGYQETTVAEIAVAAGVSPRTFFSYFSTKEAVIFARVDESLDLLVEQLADRPADQDTLTCLREWLAFITEVDPAGQDAWARLVDALARAHDSIAAYGVRQLDRIGHMLAASLKEEFGGRGHPTLPRITAAAAVAAVAASMPFGGLGVPGSDELPWADRDPVADLDLAISFVRAGVEASAPELG